MADFFFVIKTFLFTLAIVVLMQIQVGEYTIEERSHAWIQESAIHRTLGKVALGAATVLKDSAQQVQGWIAGTGESVSASTAER